MSLGVAVFAEALVPSVSEVISKCGDENTAARNAHRSRKKDPCCVEDWTSVFRMQGCTKTECAVLEDLVE